ncbi:MAG: helix-turn-helix domain-containing protein [Candidatus Micrarchaeia archaeon]|jgi:transcriptional regulator with XRE-family HTH domain
MAGIKTFGTTARSIRESAGISLRTLAKVLDYSAAYVSAIELGFRNPPGNELVVATWAEAIGADVVDMVELAAQGRPRPCRDCPISSNHKE